MKHNILTVLLFTIATARVFSAEQPDLNDTNVVATLFASAKPLTSLIPWPQENGENVYFPLADEIPYTGWTKSYRTQFNKDEVSTLMWLEQGKFHGPYGKWYKNGQMAEQGNYINGVITGRVTMWYKNGQLRDIDNYISGAPFGKSTNYFENGQIQEVGQYKNGKMDGLWISFYETGERLGETNWRDGRPHGKDTRWHANGTKGLEQIYKNGTLDGLATEWDKNGKVISKWRYKAGKRFSTD